MKRRFRYYARQGWEVVEVDRANLYDWSEDAVDFGNARHYKEMHNWCAKHVPQGVWASTITVNDGIKKFAFKNPKYATLFRLHWS